MNGAFNGSNIVQYGTAAERATLDTSLIKPLSEWYDTDTGAYWKWFGSWVSWVQNKNSPARVPPFTLTAGMSRTILVNEGDSLTVGGDASASATITRSSDSATWAIGASTTVNVAPIVGYQQYTIVCTAGSITANVIDGSVGGVQSIKSGNGVMVALRGSNGKATQVGLDVRNSFLSRTVSGAIASSNIVQTSTFLTVTASPVPYYALRISIGHLGGGGPITGFKTIVAASDDIGNRDFSDLTSVAFKKCTTPKRSGTEYNTIVTDGSPGWKAVTWNGAATISIADPGAGNRVVVVSDMIYETGVLDSVNNCYPLLIRYICGSAGLTFVNNLTGVQVGTNEKTDFPEYVFISLSRGSTDAVTTPSNWYSSSTPSASSSASEITVEYFHINGSVTTVSVVGDSRSGVSAEFSATKNYRSFERYLGKTLTSLGIPSAITCHGISGAVMAVYQPYAMADYTIPTPSNWLVYTVYSINDGVPTASIMALCKARALQIIEKARNVGQHVLLISAFPAGLSGVPTFNSGQLLLLDDLNTFCQNIADVTFNAMKVYGNADGSWARLNYDASHMTDEGYQDLAKRISAFISTY